ncbi:MAG: V-type ATP synthase subunit E [Clostridia bacterium]|nr:V-type ATP synthase subunit E [Clostridia bacterium]
MERETKFVQKIIVDANKQKESIKKEAQQKAKNILKEKEHQEKEFFNSEKKLLKNELENLLKNEKDISFLEQNQVVLSAKQQILLSVFDLALEKLKKLPAKDEILFVENILTKFAENNDELIVSNKKGEKERVEKLSVFKQKKLKIKDVSNDISGGVIIASLKCEQDFSFEGLIKDKYQNSFYQIAKQLF